MQDDLEYQEESLEEEDEMTVEHSTKQPTKSRKKLTKCQWIESTENELLKKAIKCMDQATADGEGTVDNAELFGRYVICCIGTESIEPSE